MRASHPNHEVVGGIAMRNIFCKSLKRFVIIVFLLIHRVLDHLVAPHP